MKLHRRVCLIQTEDAVLAEELLARKKLAQDIVGRLTDRVLLVRPGRVEAVIQELQKMGHTPQVAAQGAGAAHGLTACADSPCRPADPAFWSDLLRQHPGGLRRSRCCARSPPASSGRATSGPSRN